MSQCAADMEVKDFLVRKGGRAILEIPSLQVRRGEILALVGPNGAGKTTLIHALALLEKPHGGELIFQGEKVSYGRGLTALRRKTGVVLQQPFLLDATVHGNVAAGLEFRGTPGGETRRRVGEALAFFGIGHLAGRSARKLSGGESARVSLARAFVLRPEILLLDEPFSSLDPPTRESLIGDLEKMLRDTPVTAVISTHDVSEAVRLAVRIAVMNGGKILQIGPADEVINSPASEFVAGFVGVETVLSCRVSRANEGTFIAAVAGREIEAVGKAGEGDPVTLCIRPENVTLSVSPVNRGEISARNVFRGSIKKILPRGYYYKVSLDCGFPLTSCVTKHSIESLGLHAGKEVTATFKATAIHVIRKTR